MQNGEDPNRKREGGPHAHAAPGQVPAQVIQRGGAERHGRFEGESNLEETKPEAVYFTEINGHRGAIMIVNLEDPSRVPALAEPWFLTFSADVEIRAVMTPDDLKRAGLDALGKKWS